MAQTNSKQEQNHEQKTTKKSFSSWYKNLSKKKKIFFFLWIFIPLFIVILVGSLLGTNLSHYKKDFASDSIVYLNANYNTFLQTQDINGQNYTSINYHELADFIAQSAKNQGILYWQATNPNSYYNNLVKNNYFVYLSFGKSLSSNAIEVINKLPYSIEVTNSFGIYDQNYANSQPLTTSYSAYEKAYLYVNNNFLSQNSATNSSTSGYYLVVSQLQTPYVQLPDFYIHIS